MLDPRTSRTDYWTQPAPRVAAGVGIDPAAATMAQPTFPTIARPPAAPEYAWSNEPVVVDEPARAVHSPRLLRPLAAAGAGAGVVAAVAATLFVVFSGSATARQVTPPNATVTTPAAHVAASTAVDTTPAPARTTHSTHTHQQSPGASVEQSAPSQPTQQSQPSQPTTDYSQPRHDTSQSHWTFFRPHFDSSESHEGSHYSRGHRDQSTDRHSFDPSSDGQE
jgi:hypothetical protein